MKRSIGLLVGLMALVAAPIASATVAASDLTAIDASITADVGTVLPYAFGVLATVLSAVIGFKLVKKFTSSAT